MSDPETSKWHSIRPWNAQLSLHTREITSVSATFILSTEPNGEIVSTTASLGYTTIDGGSGEGSSTAGKSKKSTSPLAEILENKGLQVKVNGVNWPRVYVQMDDNGDEAVIIVYGFMPGREYDIDLGMSSIPNQLVKFEDTSDSTAEMDDLSNSSASDPPQALSTPSTSPSRTIPNSPPATPPPSISLEDRLNQLRHNLSVINAERETLLATIKSARKDSQKADAALRAEIDALKRASEKAAANELRTKQKILALQEAVKRAQASTKETEEQVIEVQGHIPALEEQKRVKEAEYETVKAEASKIRKKRDEELEKERRRHETMRAELTALTNKLEKLTTKTEKHNIPDLESRLVEIQNEIDEEERFLEQTELQRNPLADSFEDLNRLVSQSVQQQAGYRGYEQPAYRARHQSLGFQSGPGPISRPSTNLPAPIQRPTFSPPVNDFGSRPLNHTTSLSLSSGTAFAQSVSSSSIWSSPSARHSQTSLLNSSPSFNHTYAASHQQQQVSAILTNPARRGSLGASSALPTSNSTSSSPVVGTKSSPGVGTTLVPSASSSSSTLSSRAPAFEPGKGRGLGLKISTSSTSLPFGGRNGGGNNGNGSSTQSPGRGNATASSVGVIGAGRK